MLPFSCRQAVKWLATKSGAQWLENCKWSLLFGTSFNKVLSLPSGLAILKILQELLKQLKVLFSGSLHRTFCELLMFPVGVSLYKQFKANLIASLTVAVVLQGSWPQLEEGNDFELAQLCLALTSSLLA